MSDESEEQDRSIYLRLVLGLLPFDVDITAEVVDDLLTEIDETSWPSVMRRSANLGLVLGTIGFIGTTAMLYQLADISNTPLQHIGPAYRLGIAVVGLMWFAKVVLGFIQNIDTGDSPVVPKEQQSRLTGLLEFVSGVGFIGLVSIPLYEIWSKDILFVILIAVTTVGIAVAGVCLTIGGAYDFLARWNDTPDDVALKQTDERKGD